jgi:hypothetical protein
VAEGTELRFRWRCPSSPEGSNPSASSVAMRAAWTSTRLHACLVCVSCVETDTSSALWSTALRERRSPLGKSLKARDAARAFIIPQAKGSPRLALHARAGAPGAASCG